MFKNAIVKPPGRSMVHGLTEAGLGHPDYEKALEQHRQYTKALETCGLEVLTLDADEEFPDSTFIEDAALLIPECAILTRPAAASRRNETRAIRSVLETSFPRLETISAPGTLDGGDVMQVGKHFYIGLSQRTNRSGAEQLTRILQSYGYSASTIPVTQFLHLKTGVTCVAEGTFLATGEFVDHSAFAEHTALHVADEEAGGVNCIAINGRVLMPAGFPGVHRMLTELGMDIVTVDISEFAKLDGGLTCLSLRY